MLPVEINSIINDYKLEFEKFETNQKFTKTLDFIKKKIKYEIKGRLKSIRTINRVSSIHTLIPNRISKYHQANPYILMTNSNTMMSMITDDKSLKIEFHNFKK